MMRHGRSSIRLILVYLVAASIFLGALVWAILLPNIVKDSGFSNLTLTDTRIPLRVVIAGGGLLLAAGVVRFARPRERRPWTAGGA